MEANEPQIVSPWLNLPHDGQQSVPLEQNGERPELARSTKRDTVQGDQAAAIVSEDAVHAVASATDDHGDSCRHLSDPDVQLQVYTNEIRGFTKDGKGYKGICPFHADHEPSLRVDFKDGKWLWFCHPCHAGGNAFELLKRLGKTPKRKEKDKREEPTATYDYTDKDGNLLFQALRYGNGKGKTFAQRRPDGKRGWIWSVPEDVRTLYRLPEVAKATQVFIVEGEKDVETARKLGFTATTNSMGAGKWLPKYTELLAGKEIVLIPDIDKAGEKHRDLVLRSLCETSQHPASIKVIQLPKGKDLTEWVEAGGDSSQLKELVDQAEKFAYVEQSTGKFVIVGERDYGIVVVCKSELAAVKYKKFGFETLVWQKDDEEWLALEAAGKKVALTFKSEAVVAALLPTAESVKTVASPVDSASQFLDLFAKAPERRIRLTVSDADAFVQKEIPPREVLMYTKAGVPIFYKQSINQIFAWRGTGKTYVVLGMIKAIVRGEKFLTWNAKKPAKVLYVEGEIPAYQMQERLRQVVGTSNGNLRIVTLDEQPDNEIPSLKTEYGRKLVEEALGDSDVLVLDSISTLFNFATNDEDPWLEIMAWFKKLRSKGLCIIFLHHAGKSGLQRGASKSEDLLDISIKLAHPVDYRVEEGLRANLTFDKTRGVAMIDGEFQVSMEVKDGVAEFFSSPTEKAKTRKKADNYERAKQLFQQYPGLSFRELEKESGIPSSSLQRYKEDWLKEQAKDGDGKGPKEKTCDPWQGLHNGSKKDGMQESTPFIGAEDQVKKPPARELTPLAKHALAEMAERDKKRA